MKNPSRYFETSSEIIRLAVMMYVRYPLSLRQVEDLLHERGIDISHETVGAWWNRKAALRFLRKAMTRYGCPEVIETDRLRSYRAAMKQIGNQARQVTGRWLNNRAENLHQPFRRPERAMVRFRSSKSLQKFASIHASFHNHFNQERHFYDRQNFKLIRTAALEEWRQLAS